MLRSENLEDRDQESVCKLGRVSRREADSSRKKKFGSARKSTA